MLKNTVKPIRSSNYTNQNIKKRVKRLSPRPGIEPGTPSTQGERTTNELRGPVILDWETLQYINLLYIRVFYMHWACQFSSELSCKQPEGVNSNLRGLWNELNGSEGIFADSAICSSRGLFGTRNLIE